MSFSIYENKAETIAQMSYGIGAIIRIKEALRAHASGEIPLDADELTELAADGYLLGGLSAAAEQLARAINLCSEEIADCCKRKERPLKNRPCYKTKPVLCNPSTPCAVSLPHWRWLHHRRTIQNNEY